MLKIEDIYVGKKVFYKPPYMKTADAENGIVKSISDSGNVFVVYHWSDEPENFKDYTAARTSIQDLHEGWVIDGKCELYNKLETLKQFGLNESL